MSSGFFFGDDNASPSLNDIATRRALAQMLLQRNEAAGQYGGLANAGNEILGALLLRQANRQDTGSYQHQLAAMLGANQPNTVNVTPKVATDSAGQPVAPDPSLYNQPAESFQSGTLGMAPDKAKMLANILQGVEPDQGRQTLQNMALQQLEPKPLQFHPATDNAYDAAGNIIIHGTPPEPTVPAGYRKRADGTYEYVPGGPADPHVVGNLAGIRREQIVAHPMPRVAGHGRGGGKAKPTTAGYGNPSSLF